MEELKVKVVEVSQEKEQPQGNDYIRVTVEIDGRKIAVWTTESNINALRFDILNNVIFNPFNCLFHKGVFFVFLKIG